MPRRSESREVLRERALALLANTSEAEWDAIQRAAESDPDNPPLTEEQLAQFKPMSAARAAKLTRSFREGSRALPPARSVSVRLAPEVVEPFRATGPGWQARIEAVLRAHRPPVE